MSNLSDLIAKPSQDAIQTYYDVIDRAIQGLVSMGYSLDRIQLAYLVEPFCAEIWVDNQARYKIDGTWTDTEFKVTAKTIGTNNE